MNKTYPEIIKSIIDDARASGQKRISLVDVIWQYDGRNKLAVLISEINAALKTIDWISFSKEGKELFLIFNQGQGNNVEVSEADFKWADNEYRRRFAKALKNIKTKPV